MDLRPETCRFRLIEEGKAAPRSSCSYCKRSITSKPPLGKECFIPPPPKPEPMRQRLTFPTGWQKNAPIAIHITYNEKGYYPKFKESLVYYGITAEECREAAHLLNQLAEHLESSIQTKTDDNQP